MSAFSKRVEQEEEEDRLDAWYALRAAREAYDRQNVQLQVVTDTYPHVQCVVCDDRGCEHCPKV